MAPPPDLAPEALEEAGALAAVDDDADDAVDDEEEAKPVRVEAAEEPSAGRTGDPVRIYLREMGSVALLTREGEVEIAKRIEVGETAMVCATLSTPHALHYVLALADKI